MPEVSIGILQCVLTKGIFGTAVGPDDEQIEDVLLCTCHVAMYNSSHDNFHDFPPPEKPGWYSIALQ